jgi:hypothetical protein
VAVEAFGQGRGGRASWTEIAAQEEGGGGEGGHTRVSSELAPLQLRSFSKTLVRPGGVVGGSENVRGGASVWEKIMTAHEKEGGEGAQGRSARSRDIGMVTDGLANHPLPTDPI